MRICKTTPKFVSMLVMMYVNYCGNVNCPSTHPCKGGMISIRSSTEENATRRDVRGEEEAIVKQRLQSLGDTMMEGVKAYICGDILCGFNVDELISINDVLDKTTVMSFTIAEKIIKIINENFRDTEMYMFVSWEMGKSDSE